MSQVMAVIDAPPTHLVKSVLLAVDDTAAKEPDHPSSPLFLFGVPSDRRLHMGKVAKLLSVSRDRLRMATQMELEERTGFQIGSIPPFAMPTKIPVILDTRIVDLGTVWCGTGKATESLRVSVEHLKILSNCTFSDVSKPGDTI